MSQQQAQSYRDTYTFQAQPRALATKPKYRDPQELQDELAATSNLMWDSRVVRGQTLGRVFQPQQHGVNTSKNLSMHKSSKQIKRANAQRKAKLVKIGAIRPTFETMTQMHAGVRVSKKRVEVPLHLYLTEQVEEVVTNVESTQTDTFIEEVDENAFEQRYIPAKTGVDSGTQVDNSLVFVYERDVKPILSTVVSKTLQQALMEVVEEEEIEFMRRKHVAMEDDDAEAAQNQSERVQDERVLADAMAAKLRAKREAKNATASIVDKVASANFAQHFFRHLQRDALAVLDDQNFFPDPVVDAVEAALPAIYAEVKEQVSAHVQTQKAVEDLIRAGLAALTVEVQNTAADYRAKKAVALELEAAKSAYNKARAVRRMKVFLYIHSEETGRIGPVVLRGDDTIADVTSSVVKILQDKADDIDSEFEAPAVERLSFLYNDRVLQPDDILCNLGVANLGSLRMNVEPLPEPEPEVTETEGEEDDEDATATETEDTEGDNTETDYTDSTEYTDTTA